MVGGQFTLLEPIVTTFPDRVRTILEWSVEHRDELMCIFRHPLVQERNQEIVSILGELGDANTVALLKRHLNDPQRGRGIVNAVRKLQDK